MLYISTDAIIINFNPRSPQRERRVARTSSEFTPDISIHAPRKGSDEDDVATLEIANISIHAPRKGSDLNMLSYRQYGEISIHAPRKGSDVWANRLLRLFWYFNPRSPQRERRMSCLISCRIFYFNPRSPQRERRVIQLGNTKDSIFQSTLPAKGATAERWPVLVLAERSFQSTLPAKGATNPFL